MLPTLLIATRNAHKTREIAQILAKRFSVQDMTSMANAPEVEETGDTFESNAALKACAASQLTGGWALADDSGLEVEILNGAPGVRSARYAGESASDADNNRLLLQNLLPYDDEERTARFRCCLVLAHRGAMIAVFNGTVNGVILRAPKGSTGFGYDPLFMPNGYQETFGELPAEVKNQISHRSRALSQFSAWLEANPSL